VFDGHHGAEAAVYGSTQLHMTLLRYLQDTDNVKEAIQKAFADVDRQFCEKSELEQIKSGATVVVVMIIDGILYTAWAGDSLATIYHDDGVHQLVAPHKPEREVSVGCESYLK
jgi:serine/threonine protein phosphatase PrpC